MKTGKIGELTNVFKSSRAVSRKILITFFILLLLISFWSFWYWNNATSKSSSLRMGMSISAANIGYWVAADEGFFKAEGLNVSFVEFSSGSKTIEALVAGGLDVGLGSLLTLARAYDSDIGIKIATDGGHIDEDHLGSFVVLRPNSTVQSMADLKGKTIAITGWGSAQEMALKLLLKNCSLTMSDVKVVILPFDRQVESLASGRIDAAFLVEPYLNYAADNFGCRKLCDAFGSIFPDHRFQITTAFFSENFVAEHKDVVEGFIKAYGKAIEWMDSHPDETRSILAKYTGLDPALVGRIGAYAYSPNLDEELVERCLNLFFEQGCTQRKINATEIICAY